MAPRPSIAVVAMVEVQRLAREHELPAAVAVLTDGRRTILRRRRAPKRGIAVLASALGTAFRRATEVLVKGRSAVLTFAIGHFRYLRTSIPGAYGRRYPSVSDMEGEGEGRSSMKCDICGRPSRLSIKAKNRDMHYCEVCARYVKKDDPQASRLTAQDLAERYRETYDLDRDQ
jgi:hypothetical protein